MDPRADFDPGGGGGGMRNCDFLAASKKGAFSMFWLQ